MDLLWFKNVILKLIAKSKNKIRMLINIKGTKQKYRLGQRKCNHQICHEEHPDESKGNSKDNVYIY